MLVSPCYSVVSEGLSIGLLIFLLFLQSIFFFKHSNCCILTLSLIPIHCLFGAGLPLPLELLCSSIGQSLSKSEESETTKERKYLLQKRRHRLLVERIYSVMLNNVAQSAPSTVFTGPQWLKTYVISHTWENMDKSSLPIIQLYIQVNI